jgi:hypothetical protein
MIANEARYRSWLQFFSVYANVSPYEDMER